MPYQDIKLDPYGVVSDTNALDVEAEWTNVQNMRFNDNACQKIGGEVLGDSTTVQPYHLQFNGNHLTPLWYYMGDGAVYKTQFNTDTLLTTGVPSAGTDWDSTLFNNIPVFNNTVDPPWTTIDDLALTPVPAFPTDLICEAIRPYASYLIALNITDTGTGDKQENRLIWSDASDAGALPASWDIADPTTLAGDAYLTSTKGEIIDGASLRDMFVVYKTHSMYLLRQVPGQTVMKIDKVQVNSGLLAKNCVAEFKGKHFVVSDADVVLFDGQNVTSIADKRVRSEIFANIDIDNYANTYIVRYDRQDEFWVCFPTTGQTVPNRAAIWNWKDDTWTFRDLDQSYHIASGLANFATSPAWSAAIGSWEDYIGSWLPISNNPTTDTLVSASTMKLGIIDDGYDSYNVPMPSSLEKHSMGLDSDRIKMVDSIIPRITADVGTQLWIRIGTQMLPDDTITWHPEQEYIVGTDRDTHHLAKGRYISVRFRTDSAGLNWKLHGFRMKTKECGKE